MKFILVVKKLWWFFLIGFLVGGIIVWLISSANTKKSEANKYTVRRETLTEILSLSGEVDAEEKVTLRFQTSGLLAWVGVKEGDSVKKYQVLATLDKRDLQNSMSKLLNTYSKSRWDFEQAQADNKNWQTLGMTDLARDTVKRTLDKYQFDLNNSVLSVESQALSIKFASLWTPIEGLITKIDAPFAGANITPATATFEVVNPKTVYFSATADQTEVISFTSGMKGKVILDSFPDTEFDGVVKSISFTPKAGESGTVYGIKIGIDPNGPEDKLKIGMTGDVNFILSETPNVLVVPEGYLKKDNGQYTVTVIEAGRKVTKKVTVGKAIEGMVEITGGLNEKDVIYNQP